MGSEYLFRKSYSDSDYPDYHTLSGREIELVICTAHPHRGQARDTAERVDAIRGGQEPRVDNARERVVYDLTKIAMEPGARFDEVFARAERVLDPNGKHELAELA